jgi:eukaryotic-like serine/threonine-protein kinase
MSLAPGHRFGPYEIQAPVGRGGMGEVYRARDTRLGRDVAIKVSHQQFNERFDREARTISSLNHPNICALYDVGPDYLVMEYVDGESPRGPMAADEALAIAMQIAEALREAHQKGIVHRDLKPANIKITPDGKVKVLDFGLAKALDTDSVAGGAGPDLTQSPTITSPAMMTHAGMILGTAAYMAPEQARGKTVDARADIWAFGVVLYELLTGTVPFKGDDLTETLASVVKDHPDLGVIPMPVRPLVEACLQKDPKKRLQSIGDVGLLLQREATATPPARANRTTMFALGAVAIVATLVAMTLAYVHLREMPPGVRSLRLSIPIPDGASVGWLELSPDGTRVLVRILTGDGNAIYVRSLDANDLHRLPGTENGRSPFWSYDGRSIGFFAYNSLRVIPSGGGPVRVLCSETGLGKGGTWNRDGVILFASESGALRRVDAAGGECRTVKEADAEFSATAPRFLPGGQHFFYVLGRPSDTVPGGVYVATLDEPRGRRVLDDMSEVVYTPSSNNGGPAHLIFLRDGTLMAQPFDEKRLQTVGDPFVITRGVSLAATQPQLLASASADGALVYVAGRSHDSQLTWFDRSGKALGTVGPIGLQFGVSLSPDGNKATIARTAINDTVAVWLHDLVNGSSSRLTPTGSPGGDALWSADSRTLWFGMTTSQGPATYRRDLVTGEQERLETTDPNAGAPTSRSLDGKFVVYTVIDPQTRSDIWYAPVESGKADRPKAVKLIATDAIEAQGQLSPDGKWLAYVSTEGGPYTVYVRPFPAGAGVWRAYPGLAEEPRWRADGKELFFKTSLPATGGASIWSVSIVADGAGLRLGVPQKLFDTRADTMLVQGNSWSYGASPDGQRFLVNTLTETGAATVNVITNWQQSVPRR